jgi:cell wall-associated NlpC family hydrolase
MPLRPSRLLPALALVVSALALAPAALAEGGAAGHPENRAPQRIPTPLGQLAADVALEAVGVPYRWGGESPSSGFDCSGLVRWAYGRVGVDLPHSSYALYSEGRRVSQARMRAGDVLFFEGLGHVGLYLGRGRMVHAPQSGRNVEVVSLAETNYGRRLVGARRMALM